MTRFSILILSSFLLITSCKDKYRLAPQDNKVITGKAYVYPVYYDYETFHRLIDDSLPDGKWVAYYLDKKTIAFIGFYKKGKPSGLFQHFLKNGKVYHTCVYKDGKEDGPFTFWHEKEGTISMIGFNKEDKNHGEWFDWWSNGQLRRHYFYNNGLQDGLDCYYDSLGNLEWTGVYKNDCPIGEWKYYKYNRLQSKRLFVDSITKKETLLKDKYDIRDFPKGDWISFDTLGHTIERIIFNKDYTLSKKIEYFSNGKIKKEIDYNDGFMHFIGSERKYEKEKNNSH